MTKTNDAETNQNKGKGTSLHRRKKFCNRGTFPFIGAIPAGRIIFKLYKDKNQVGLLMSYMNIFE